MSTDVSGCIGLMGALFGHRYREAVSTTEAPSGVPLLAMGFDPSLAKLRNRAVVGVYCQRCGDFRGLPQP